MVYCSALSCWNYQPCPFHPSESPAQPAVPSSKLLTLVLVVDEAESKVLLGMKKRGFGVGKWNGFGGKVEASDKSIRDAAFRELKEEAGVAVADLVQHGLLLFEMQGESQLLEVHVFRGEAPLLGTLQESEEMRPEWFAIKDLPFSRMWQDDEHWYPLLFARKFFRGYFRFEGDFLLSFLLEPLKDPALLTSSDRSWVKRVL